MEPTSTGAGWSAAASPPATRSASAAPRSGWKRGDAIPADPALTLWAALLGEAGRLTVGKAFLDVGGGSGLLARAVATRTGAAPTVADPAAEPTPDVPTVRARAESLPMPDGAFDAVLFSHALHHVSDTRAALIEAARVLKPTGRVLIRTASHADLRAMPHARWIPRLLPGILESVPDADTLEAWLRAAGCSALERQSVETPQAAPLEAYAEAVALQAFRDWALSPGGGPDPRAEARAWALQSFAATPPVRETLLVAARS